MKARKWIAIVVTGGLVLELTSCTSDLAYYAVDAFVEYLPDLLDALLASVSTTA